MYPTVMSARQTCGPERADRFELAPDYTKGKPVALVPAYHTDTDPEDPVHHIYNDCPADERVIADGNAIQGDAGLRLCDFCARQNATGKF